MSFAVLSDVHANQEALKAVLADLRKRNISRVYFLGDAVGYGPDPNACVELLRDACTVLLAGNHEWGVAGFTDISFFNEFARIAIEWTRTEISRENMEILRAFPVHVISGDEGITLVHATPCEPGKWRYLHRQEDALPNFSCFDTPVCFIGHSHRPLALERKKDGVVQVLRTDLLLSADSRYIVNAGSVGQPRDGDPRACYVIYHGDRIEFVRVPYDIPKTQKKMVHAGLPPALAERLAYGM